ncbi:MAG: LacI family DNA-binding transcriptional regulator [Anaerolineae bacterium]|nr:LacI family DNA-binding transcriptional regulator [Anaerolineae bacterium]MBN8619565.1 LacI family DNA-binding transcriptional regulator [Anaerolineae bacterium]
MQAKLKDIAQKSGYSITTVSRALAGYNDVNQQTREHIMQIASELGYQPNLPARQLRIQRTHTVGLIIPSYDHVFSNEFFSQLLLGVGDAASLERYDLLISTQVPGEDEMDAYRRMVGGNRVDGMVIARTRQNDPRIEYLKQQKRPFVVNGRRAPGEVSDFPYIDMDSYNGIQAVVAHFASLGHQQIGLILPPENMAFTEYRHQGYRDGLRAAGLDYRPDYVVYGDLLRTGGYSNANLLLDRQPQLTAIVACNDLMALGVMRALQERGLRVGADVAVSGYDDIPAAEYANPPLTTVHTPIYEIGQRLVRMLIALIDDQALDETQILLPGALIVRESSGGQRG